MTHFLYYILCENNLWYVSLQLLTDGFNKKMFVAKLVTQDNIWIKQNKPHTHTNYTHQSCLTLYNTVSNQDTGFMKMIIALQISNIIKQSIQHILIIWHIGVTQQAENILKFTTGATFGHVLCHLSAQWSEYHGPRFSMMSITGNQFKCLPLPYFCTTHNLHWSKLAATVNFSLRTE